jgi:hypothetical protein
MSAAGSSCRCTPLGELEACVTGRIASTRWAALATLPSCAPIPENAMSTTRRRLHGHHATYVHHVDHGVLSIFDLDNGPTVTNDMEFVLAEIAEHGVDLQAVQVMYRDTQGIWDAVMTAENGRFYSFMSLNERDENRAREKLRALKRKDS